MNVFERNKVLCKLLTEPTPVRVKANQLLTPGAINKLKTDFVMYVRELMDDGKLQPSEHQSKELNKFLVDFQVTVHSADLDLIEDVQEVISKLNGSEEAWDLCKIGLNPFFIDWYNKHPME